jgi:hypothetical protein
MNPLLRRLQAIERTASPPVSMGDCFVCCLKTFNHKDGTASEWKPCKPGMPGEHGPMEQSGRGIEGKSSEGVRCAI